MVTKGRFCSGAEVGVLLVHGIGVQPPGETQASYGDAIARMWDQFGPRAGDYGRFDCGEHIHLTGPAGESRAIIGEGYWDDVVADPPPALRLLAWLLLSGPISILYSLTRLPRVHEGRFGRSRALTGWLVRTVLAFPVIALVQVLSLLGVAFGWALRNAASRRKLIRVMALTLGDAYAFIADPRSGARITERVVGRAADLAADSTRLLVVAHSQGGGVTLEAVASGGWPDTATSVITLGSGHKRLLLLRRLMKTRLRRIGLAALSLYLTTFSVVGTIAVAVALSEQDSARSGEYLGSVVALVLWLGLLTALIPQWLSNRWTVKRITSATNDWLDIWATHDLVPDGPASARGIRSLRVHNARSLVVDHTTYHRNAPEVISEVLDRIDADRLAGDGELLAELRRARAARHAPGWLAAWFSFIDIRRTVDAPDQVVDAEFAGLVDRVG